MFRALLAQSMLIKPKGGNPDPLIATSFQDPEASSLAGEKVNNKVLVVEDEPDMGIFISNLLNSSGFQPIVAKDKDEGLKHAVEKTPAVIIIDMMMFGEGGFLMYRDLKRVEKLKHVPVIMLSNIDRKTFFRYLRAQSIRADQTVPEPGAYLEKPLEAEELLNLVRTLTNMEDVKS